MRTLPTMHPRKGVGSKYSIRAKQVLLGGRRFNTETLVDTFPEYLASDMDISLKNRENVLSSSYQVENTYFVKVVTPRHVKAHGFLTWWRNTVFRMSRLDTPFAGFDTPLDMVEYEYNAAKHTRDNGGATVHPYAYAPIDGNSNAAAILYEYIPNSGKVDGKQKSLKAFEHATLTMRRLHNGGYTHTSIPYHVVQSVPTGEPYLTDPIGRTHDTDKALLLGIGFDIATLLARYTPYIGTLPALKTLGEHYSDVELVAAYKTALPIQVTVPGTPPWVVSHLRSSINEYADGDAVDTYLEIVGEEYDSTPDAPHPTSDKETSPYTTSKFIEAVVDDSSTEDETPETKHTYGDPLTEESDDDLRIGSVESGTPMIDPRSDPVTETEPTTRTTSIDPDELQSPQASGAAGDTDDAPATAPDDEIPGTGLTWTGDPAPENAKALPENRDETPGLVARLRAFLTPTRGTHNQDDDDNQRDSQ